MRGAVNYLTRAVRAKPLHSALLAALVLINTAAVLLASAFTADAVEEVSSSNDRAALAVTIVSVCACLAVSSIVSAFVAPLFLVIQRAYLASQIADLMRTLEHGEREGRSAGEEIGRLAEGVVSFRHREAVGASVDVLRARSRGLAGLLLFAWVMPLPALVLAAVIVIYGRSFTRLLDDVLTALDSEGPLAGRQARYVRGLHFDTDIAGELRVFRSHGWLSAKFEALSITGRAHAAASRERQLMPVVVSAVAAVVVFTAALTLLALYGLSGQIGIGAVALAIQGAFLMLDLGPIGDTGVLFRRAVLTEAAVRAASASTVHERAETFHAKAPRAQDAALPCDAAVVLDAVSFSYPGSSTPALHIDTLIIRRGEHIAIVGQNGSGKSTLLSLLAGHLTATSGSLLLPTPLSSSIAQQRAVRYPTTLAENITLGFPESDLDVAFDAVGGQASLVDLAVDTPLAASGSVGNDLSGGQWQRVGLARAMSRRSDLLLLDEPSAALDPAAEAAFFRAAVKASEDRTLVLATHQMANARFVGRVIVLHEGRIVEDGTPAELLARKGWYASMYKAQARTLGVD